MKGEEEFLEAHRRARIKWALVAVGGAVVVAGGVVGLLLVDWRKPSPEAEKARKAEDDFRLAQSPSEKELGMSDVEAAIADGCDAASVRRIISQRREVDDDETALAMARKYEATCGVDLRMRENVHDALLDLERWADAEALAAELIAGEPDDVDYWWWRASSLEELGRLEEAAHCYRQSMALSDLERSNGVHAGGFADLASKVDRLCDGALALRFYGMQTEGEITDEAEEQIAQLATYGGCQAKVGRGKAELALHAPLDVRIGGAAAKAIVDPHMPYVVISQAVAAKSQLEAPGGPLVKLVILGALRYGRLTRAAVTAGELAVDQVDVVVVEMAAGEPEAILGQGFLWYWDVMFDGPSALLSPIANAGALGEAAVEHYDEL